MMKEQHSLTRRNFLASSAALAAAGCATTGEPRVGSRPNVIFAFSDEHRYQSMSFTEMPELQTPHMARMAAEGCSFTNCISNYPVCSPYRAIQLTSRWPYQTGVIDNSLPLAPGEMTLGKAFQQGGYRTCYIGKWHLEGVRTEQHGFDRSLVWTGTHWEGVFHAAEGEVPAEGYCVQAKTDKALEFIDEAPEDPFFILLSWHPPHAKFTDPPEEKLALYPGGSLPRRPNFRDTGAGTSVLDRNGSPHYEGYHGHISAIDDDLGRLRAALEARGLGENTIVIYSSDHGSMFGSHGVGSKRQPFEESIRVPFLAVGPGIARGTKPDALFGAIDAMPTVLGLAGLPVPESCEGQDYSAWLRGGPGPDPEDQLIMHIAKDNASGGAKHPAPLFRGLRTKRFTYAVGVNGPMYLFDNEADPYQMTNLVGEVEHAGVREYLHERLRAALLEAADPFVI